MPYEDPLEAAMRALTGVEWRKRTDTLETRVNNTHMVGITEMLDEHRIPVHAEVSAARSGRYIVSVALTEAPKILKAVETTKAVVKPHRRKRNNG